MEEGHQSDQTAHGKGGNMQKPKNAILLLNSHLHLLTHTMSVWAPAMPHHRLFYIWCQIATETGKKSILLHQFEP